MDRSCTSDLIKQYLREMDRVVEQIRLEHEAARIRQDHTLALHLAEMLINLGMWLKNKTQAEATGAAYIPYLLYRDK
jgi:hypothetical protein